MKRISKWLGILFLATSVLGGQTPVLAQSAKSANPRFTSIVANEKVAATFNQMYADATNIRWSTEKNHDEKVYFRQEGKVIRAAFNRKGKFIYSIATYSEEELPKEILLMVKKNYFKKSIASVIEVHYLGKTAYLVNLEDQTSWLRVKVVDGQMAEDNFMLKSK